MNQNENEDMNSMEYLNLANDFQAQMNKKNRELTDAKLEIIELKKHIVTAYGVVRLIDMSLDAYSDFPTDIQTMFAVLRETLSEWTENEFNRRWQ
tara:strand:+ start:309 stop:593 length:285 start_codon:yes stop_codon:yes gene_type:complete